MPIHSAIIQKLLTTKAHMGRRTATHHIKPYVYGHRNATAIIDSDKTLISLRSALNFLSNLASLPSARVLFVNTNPLYDPIFDHMSRLTGHGSFLSPRAQFWRGAGFLTNPSSPKKFRSRHKRFCFAPVDPPDCVVVVDVDMKSSVIREACKVGVPVVGLVDTSVPKEVFDKITYPIVCGESVQFVYLVCNLITKTFLLHRKGLRNKAADVDDVDAKVDDDAIASASGDASKEQLMQRESNQTAEEMKVVPYSA